MSIASEIQRISGNIADSYTAISGKGGTLPVNQNSDNLADAIETIPTGTTPTGTKSITANGVYDVTDFASADVQVPTTAPAHYVEKTVDANGKLQNSTNIINLNGVTDVGDYALSGQYYNLQFQSNTSIDLSSLITISGQNACRNMFQSSREITSVDLSNLTTISGAFACYYMFFSCQGLTSVDLSSLTTINSESACYGMFQSCTRITSVGLSNLTTISGQSACYNMFYNCAGITSVDLSSLTTISGQTTCGYMFYGCAGITSVDFSSLTTISGTSPCQNMFYNCFELTTAKFNALNTMSGPISPSYGLMFAGCSKLESVEFGGLTSSTFASRKDQIAYLFNSTTGSQAPSGCTVHFPSNFDPSDPNHTFDASTLTGYPTFGGNASYIHVAFDLPATE